MEKYKGVAAAEESKAGGSQKVYERIRGKTKMSAHIYRFKGCISECFEPYLKSYSESEERKIIEAIESFMQADKIETTDYLLFSSSLHLFKNIKGSLKRCLSFSTSKALFDLHTTFKNVFRHYSKLLKKHLPQKLGTE
jgi:vacuolar protein sorting-associated protein 53